MKRRRYLIRGLIALILLLWAWHYWFRLPGVPIHPNAAISSNTALVFSYDDGRNFLSADSIMMIDALFHDLLLEKHYKEDILFIRKTLRRYRRLQDKPFRMLIGLQNAGTGNITANAIIDMRRTGFNLDSLLASFGTNRIESSRFKNYRVYRLRFDDGTELALAQSRNLLLIARYPLLIEESLIRLSHPPRSLTRDRLFKPLQYSSPKEVPFSIFINPGNLSVLAADWLQLAGKSMLQTTGESLAWLRLDMQRDSQLTRVAGRMSTQNTDNIWTAAGSQRSGQLAAMLNVIPDNIEALHWLSVSHPRWITNERNQAFDQYILPWIKDEIAFVEAPSAKFFVCHFENEDKVMESLHALMESTEGSTVYDYKIFEIQHIENQDIFRTLPTTVRVRNPYFVVIDGYVIFADSLAALEIWIDEYIVGKTLAQNATFLTLFQHLQDQQAQAFVFLNVVNMAPQIREVLQTEALLQTGQPERMGQIALLFNEKGRAWDVEGYWLPQRNANVTQQTNIAWKRLLDFDAITPPMPIGKNPQQPDAIAVQDSAFNLYLLNVSGEILWQKALDGPLLSPVHAIEYYDQNTISLLCNTARNIHLFGMDGAPQGAFPIRLQTQATNGVAVVDFNQNRDYSFFVACANGAIYGFDRIGRPLPGWNPLRGVGEVQHSMQHFQYKERDYLVVVTKEGKFAAYRRDGSYRISPIQFGIACPSPPDYQLSEESNRVVLTDERGTAHVVSMTGATFSLSLLKNADAPVKFAFADVVGDARKDYVALSGKDLTVHYYDGARFQQLYEKQFSEAQDEVCTVFVPGINTSIIGVVDKQKRQIRLVLPNGQVHPDFPLAGNTTFFIADLFQNNQNILVVSSGNSIYAYRLNI